MQVIPKILAGLLMAFVAWKFIHRQSEKPQVQMAPPTNSKCAYCGYLFLTHWASVATCPKCHKQMSAMLARRAHGPVKKTDALEKIQH